VLDHIPLDKSILRKWLKAGYIEKNVLHPTDEGTPQGGIISPVIANMVLDGLEGRLGASHGAARRVTGTSKAKIHFVRYADDFIVTGPTREILEHEVKPIVEQFMRERGLELSTEKTAITHIEDGFDFLERQEIQRQAAHQAREEEHHEPPRVL
jgi:RNA-directed DNA polymerase